jgi:hypothetical protein
MTDFSQEPGELNITATHGDDFEFSLDFDIPLSGYDFDANVVVVATNALMPMTVTDVDLSAGQIKIALGASGGLDILPTATHHWYLDWDTGSQVRRVLAGTFRVIDYP